MGERKFETEKPGVALGAGGLAAGRHHRARGPRSDADVDADVKGEAEPTVRVDGRVQSMECG